MSEQRTTRRRGRAKLALVLFVVVLGAAGAYALAESRRGTEHSEQERAGAAASSSRKLALRVKPRTRFVAPGEVAHFKLRIRGAKRKRVKLRVVDGLPEHARAFFKPSVSRKSKAKLKVETAGLRSGGYRLRLLARSGRRRAKTAVNLVITSSKRPSPPSGVNPTPSADDSSNLSGDASFRIAGDLAGVLAPGVTEPLDLELTNPGPSEISITALAVSIERVDAPRADPTHPCSLEDFSVAQFSGAYGFKLGPGQTRALSELGFPESQWPQVTMLDRPVNQDGCKGASLSFTYGGTSRGGS
jgi:hypothetical protein